MEGKAHFHKGYDDIFRFISYFYQCDTVLNLNPKSVLEIGVGNKLFSNYLKGKEINVTTCDYDSSLNPDVVADVRDLSKFKDNSFDVIVAFEILEHIAWEDLDLALKEFRRISKQYVVISVPQTGRFFNIGLEIPFVKRKLFNIGFSISRFWANMKPRSEHCWEIGFKNYPLKKVRGKMREYFDIKKDFQVPMNRYHHFFVLSK